MKEEQWVREKKELLGETEREIYRSGPGVEGDKSERKYIFRQR